jgi:glycolate oxidase
VHLSVFQPDAEQRHALIRSIFAAAVAAGGAISGEHGIGTEKQEYYLDTVDRSALALMRSIKSVFDPRGILGPDRLFGPTGESS